MEAQLCDLGLRTWNQHYTTSDGHASRNIEATLVGTDPGSTLIIGAHYDSVDCPGANDNASGVACLLEIARSMTERESSPRSTIRFVGFTNEEPPYFYTGDMGSRVYAQEVIDRREQVLGMICLETIAYYSDELGSQMIPPILRPFFDHDVGDFIGFFSNNESRDFLRNVVGAFRQYAEVPSEGLAAPSVVQGLNFSDHASFWRVGYNAVMVTDTAFMRYEHYHRSSDTPDELEWTRFTKVTDGLTKAVMELSG